MSLLYLVLADVSICYPSLRGKFFTRYSPVRHDTFYRSRSSHRLACVKHSVSVHPEPGSNSSFNLCNLIRDQFTLPLNLIYKRQAFMYLDIFSIYFSMFFVLPRSLEARVILPQLTKYVNTFFKIFLLFLHTSFRTFDSINFYTLKLFLISFKKCI